MKLLGQLLVLFCIYEFILPLTTDDGLAIIGVESSPPKLRATESESATKRKLTAANTSLADDSKDNNNEAKDLHGAASDSAGESEIKGLEDGTPVAEDESSDKETAVGSNTKSNVLLSAEPSETTTHVELNFMEETIAELGSITPFIQFGNMMGISIPEMLLLGKFRNPFSEKLKEMQEKYVQLASKEDVPYAQLPNVNIASAKARFFDGLCAICSAVGIKVLAINFDTTILPTEIGVVKQHR